MQPADPSSFIDFKAAHDSLKRNELWQIMAEHGFPAKLVRLIRATLDKSKSIVRVADKISSPFVTLDGLKQGDAFSNLQELEGTTRRTGEPMSGTIITRSHILLGFADDIDIIRIDRWAVEEPFIPFEGETVRIGLTINITKTNYNMIAGGKRQSGRDSSDEVVLGGEKFEVTDVVYLYALYDREVRRWIAAGVFSVL